MTQFLDPDALAGLFRPGMTVFVAAASGEPIGIHDALKEHAAALAGVTFIMAPVPGINRRDWSALNPDSRLLSYFAAPELAEGMAAGRVSYVPMSYRGIHDDLDRRQIDMAIVQVAPEKDGSFGSGMAFDLAAAPLANAPVVLAEVNAAMPDLAGAPRIPAARIDHAFATDRTLPVLGSPKADAVTDAIGAHVAALVVDGACIQLGIGAMPAAVLAALTTRNDLGVHSGMIPEGTMPLIEGGQITGKAKTVDRGLIVTGAVMGSQALYDFAAARQDLVIRPVTVTHDVGYIGAIDRFTAINSALEIDLFGNVNAEGVGGRLVSGIGGSIDFVRGAARSKGGRAIVALPATAAGGKASRIVPVLPPGAPVTAARGDADWIVTEHGARRLKGLSLDGRAEALVEIAAPEFRDWLRASWAALRSGRALPERPAPAVA
ncbi:acetyl-CoA hydrolase/transferase family protein [Zavarzinia sp. CC-PAN008]|uniref:acetyl-CoA hydrolase/transferase family protein n=1 Tax=Zavarzinia sp. CC-PAN008 TaxID=3243332 RepID=UPI003F74608E